MDTSKALAIFREHLKQYKNDYIFNSDKFENAFSYRPETYENGIKLMSETFYQQK